MRYEIDGSPRRMREGSEETLRVPAVSIAERGADGVMTERGRATGTHYGSTGTGTGKKPKIRDGPAESRGGWPKIIDFPIRGRAQNMGWVT
jgi:hypothetical protein